MDAGKVDLLLILGGNPLYDAPHDFDFTSKLKRVPTAIHLSPYYDETSVYCHWHVSESHYLETWSDARAYDGTATIIQPSSRRSITRVQPMTWWPPSVTSRLARLRCRARLLDGSFRSP